jgi:hypothetical protein
VPVRIPISPQAQVMVMIDRHAAGKKPLIPLIDMSQGKAR